MEAPNKDGAEPTGPLVDIDMSERTDASTRDESMNSSGEDHSPDKSAKGEGEGDASQGETSDDQGKPLVPTSGSKYHYHKHKQPEDEKKEEDKKSSKKTTKKSAKKKKKHVTSSDESEEESQEDSDDQSENSDIDSDDDKPKKKNPKKLKNKKRKDVKLKAEDQRSAKERVDDVLAELGEGATREGLTNDEAAERLLEYGPNALPKAKQNLILKFLYFFWNPLSWAMEFAALVSFILVDYVDGILIVVLLLINACIGFWEDYSSGNAIAALQKQLAPTCKCVRDGEVVPAALSVELVPGDVVLLRLGDVVPADCYLLDDSDQLKIDQSSLTGESLPVNRYPGDEIYSGSIVKQGEMKAIVHATGLNTFFGKAASLVNKSHKKSHIHVVLKSIGYFCIILIAIGVVAELIVQFGVRSKPCTGVYDAACAPLNNMLVLIVGGLPIAMPTVLSVTMALGASALAKKKAIVSRLTAVEEIAGMEILCSDKTGTLTKNELTVANPIAYVGELDDVIFDAALASKPENGDAIDIAMVEYCSAEQKEHRDQFKLLQFKPFDPVSKRTEAKLESPDGEVFHTCKGAPQVVLRMSENCKKLSKRVMKDIDRLGSAGYRSLGVAVGDKTGKKWTMTGLIPMFDPPRDDTKETIAKAEELGVSVKMITGDHLVIAKETAKLLGMGSNIFPSELMKNEEKARAETGLSLMEIVNHADGFAEVFPEDKYAIVESLQKGKHIIGMTGDGVNDAPALKKANIGIAVEGATDAARSASDIVLTKEGLSVIVDAIIGSRKIFQRMKNYCMYSISVCVRVVLTFGILTVAYDYYFPTIAMVLLAIFNDGSMLTISKDKVKPSKNPDTWNLLEIFGTAIALGSYLTLSTIILFELAVNSDTFHNWFGLDQLTHAESRGLIYLQVSSSGLATVFVTRAHGFSWMVWRERPGIPVVIAFVVAQTVATVLCAYGLGGFPFDDEFDFEGSGWWFVLVGWIWFIIWFPLMDIIKFITRAIMRGEVMVHHHKFSLHLQLVHGHPFHGQHPGAVQEDHVVTMEDFSGMSNQLKSRMRKVVPAKNKKGGDDGDVKMRRMSKGRKGSKGSKKDMKKKMKTRK